MGTFAALINRQLFGVRLQMTRALSDEMGTVSLRYPHISHTVKSSMKENPGAYADGA